MAIWCHAKGVVRQNWHSVAVPVTQDDDFCPRRAVVVDVRYVSQKILEVRMRSMNSDSKVAERVIREGVCSTKVNCSASSAPKAIFDASVHVPLYNEAHRNATLTRIMAKDGAWESADVG